MGQQRLRVVKAASAGDFSVTYLLVPVSPSHSSCNRAETSVVKRIESESFPGP